MKSLNELLHQDKLVDIKNEISLEFAQLQKGYYDAKLAVMLSFIASESMKKLKEIDQQNFPTELKEQLTRICNDFSSIASALKRHLEENAKLIKIIDKTNSDYPKIESQIIQLLTEFDDLLRISLEERDKKPICDL